MSLLMEKYGLYVQYANGLILRSRLRNLEPEDLVNVCFLADPVPDNHKAILNIILAEFYKERGLQNNSTFDEDFVPNGQKLALDTEFVCSKCKIVKNHSCFSYYFSKERSGMRWHSWCRSCISKDTIIRRKEKGYSNYRYFNKKKRARFMVLWRAKIKGPEFYEAALRNIVKKQKACAAAKRSREKRLPYYQEQQRIYYLNNKDRCDARTKQWREKNKIRVRLTQNSWAEKNKEKVIEYRERAKEKDPEARRIKRLKYQQEYRKRVSREGEYKRDYQKRKKESHQ